jgi:hypothetical protein
MTLVFSSRSSSKFIDWIETRREISLEEFDRIFSGTLENFGFDEAPPEKIFIYRGDVWIALLNHSSVRQENRFFWTYIEKDDYESCNLEDLEMRLYLWAIDENCEL